jgi:spore coat protein U-like protein
MFAKITVTLLLSSCSILSFGDCSFAQVPTISFGCAPTSAAGCLATSTFKVRCNLDTDATITLSTGQSGSYSPRVMMDTAAGLTLNYNVYLDANYSQIFGDGSQGTSIIQSSFPKNKQVSYNLFSKILSSTVWAGNYSDTLGLTLNY